MNLPFLKKQEPTREQQPEDSAMQERVEEAMQQIGKWREMAQTKEGLRELAAEFYQMAAALALLSMDVDELKQLLREASEDLPKPDSSEPEPKPEPKPEPEQLVIPRGEPQPTAPKSARPRSLREIAGMP